MRQAVPKSDGSRIQEFKDEVSGKLTLTDEERRERAWKRQALWEAEFAAGLEKQLTPDRAKRFRELCGPKVSDEELRAIKKELGEYVIHRYAPR